MAWLTVGRGGDLMSVACLSWLPQMSVDGGDKGSKSFEVQLSVPSRNRLKYLAPDVLTVGSGTRGFGRNKRILASNRDVRNHRKVTMDILKVETDVRLRKSTYICHLLESMFERIVDSS